MALPPGLSPKTVTLGIASFADGSLATGRATVSMPVNVVHTPSNRPIFSSEMTKPFVDGEVTFDLLPTDAPGLNRVDWSYKLRVEIQGATVQPEVIYFLLPTAGPDVVDLDGLVTVPSSAGIPISVDVLTTEAIDPATADYINDPTSATSVALRAASVAAVKDSGQFATRARVVAATPTKLYTRKVAATPPTVELFSDPTAAGITGTSQEWLASDASPYITFAAGGAYVNDTNQGRWGATQNRGATGPYSVLVGTDGGYAVFKIRSWPGHSYRFRVDGEYVTSVDPVTGPGDGSIRYLKLTFPDARPRQIRMDHTGQLYSVIVPTGYTVWAPKPRGPRVAVVGDSYTGGAGNAPTGYNGISSWVWTFADLLGWEDVINAGIGGSGWIAKGNPAASFEDRAPDIITWAPDMVIFAGDQNDSGSSAALVAAAVTRTLTAVRAGLPNALLVTTGGFHAGAPVDGTADTYWTPRQTAILAAAAPFGPTINTTDKGLFTGTGKAGTAGTGNGNRYIQADGVHPTQAGADYLGYRMAEAVAAMVRTL